ncbi:dihydrolipoamide acetyltransferase family protein [Terricaulis silvestris]|uniref:Dihydrolipoamide acetyltransferase component of pyruvate dehydrogenase complex n=1 Tax=Terricaulis silvestris TaxID=2686094 RepID=A0A6I6MKT5_9CAUL|nr:2-oxo acid dehydrogenase subunit E2 [Terricaulis silvestris]QGZ93848.1 Dihydrolipoyllysine-residue succinyltransferase component of 2-oxoglutarate dehydrogenase complex [Terricaulis silvestris]
MSDTANIVMPLEQEGSKSVVRVWLKRVGDAVKRDEPIVELETDKVAVEVPAPADGVLASIALNEGEEAAPGATLGVLTLRVAAADRRLPAGTPANTQSVEAKWPAGSRPSEGEREARLSPLVKRLLSDHKLDAADVNGTGRDGRITHKDVEDFVARGKAMPAAKPAPAAIVGGRVPHDAMRRSIAEHMSRSVATAPHVTAVFEADFSAIAAHRTKHKDAYARSGAQLTYSAYIVRAAAEAMKVSPNVNARWHDDFLEVFEDANIGMGVALGDKGLIVPVIQRAQTLTLKETATKLTDLAERARKNALKPADVQAGTFTISNHGVSGSLVATPIIINQPQSAILGVGKLEKRVVVRTIGGADAMVIKPMAYVSLTIDHRVLDGHQTNAWLTRFVENLETWPLEDEQ